MTVLCLFLSHVFILQLFPLLSARVGSEACTATANQEAVFSRKDRPTTPQVWELTEYSVKFLDLAAAECQPVTSAPAPTWLPVVSVANGE